MKRPTVLAAVSALGIPVGLFVAFPVAVLASEPFEEFGDYRTGAILKALALVTSSAFLGW